MKDGLYTILEGDHYPMTSMPVSGGGWWFNKRTIIDAIFNPGWLHRFDDQKPNTDIQKWFGYSTDPLRRNIIRLGCNNGYDPDPKRSRYDGKHLSLYIYLTRNWKRFTMPGQGKMFIGKVIPNIPVVIIHQLTDEGYPYFAVLQQNQLLGQLTIPQKYSLSSLGGLNMSPFVEYGIGANSGAPERLALTLNFRQEGRIPNSHLQIVQHSSL